MCCAICDDNRFEIIKNAKKELIESTNIESSTEEMAVIDDFLFRMWQMKWLPGCVDAVPVVHKKWLHDDSGANFCSGCMKYVYEDDKYHLIWHTRYCPHCGARMDEKDGDSDATDRR